METPNRSNNNNKNVRDESKSGQIRISQKFQEGLVEEYESLLLGFLELKPG